MQTGISTASLFGRKVTEDALEFISKMGVQTAEIFLESYCEYNQEFGKLLNERKGCINVHSMHVLTTQFEPQLYSVNERAQKDSFVLLDNALSAGQQVGVKYYTFHGGARFKKTPIILDMDKVGVITQKIINKCREKDITLAYENVHWGYYNYIGFYSELKKRTQGLRATLDIKQARQSGIFYGDFIKEMGNDIVTVHLSDINERGKMCLPGKGVTDFDDLFLRLNDVGFDGALILEVYKSDFNDYSELIDSLNFVKDKAEKRIKLA